MSGSEKSPLLTPFDLHGLPLANRVVMAPLTRGRAGARRVPNATMVEYYRQRASAGLIVSEATTISPQANGWVNSPGIYTEEMAAAWRPVTDAVHSRGGRIFLQLWHMGRSSHSSFHDGQPAVSASAIAINGEGIHTPIGKVPYETPRALETDEIPGVVEDYRRAAERAKQAGFDGVEVHAANGYLIDQFLQSKTNHRDDRYGGSVENRYRFLGEVVDAVKTVWPSNRVGVRLSPNGVYNDMGSPDFRETFSYAISQLDRHDLAYLHAVEGLAFGFHGLGEPMALAELRGLYRGTLIANCGYTVESGEAAVDEGLTDLVAFGRSFISNPDFVERIANGWPLAEHAPFNVWYSDGPVGYTDYPAYSEAAAATT